MADIVSDAMMGAIWLTSAAMCLYFAAMRAIWPAMWPICVPRKHSVMPAEMNVICFAGRLICGPCGP